MSLDGFVRSTGSVKCANGVRGDARLPFEHGLKLAHAIPNARFVAIESKNHLILSHEPA